MGSTRLGCRESLYPSLVQSTVSENVRYCFRRFIRVAGSGCKNWRGIRSVLNADTQRRDLNQGCFPHCEKWMKMMNGKEDRVSLLNIDRLIRDSAAEIVRNIGAAPLLVYIHEEKIRVEKAMDDKNWTDIKRRWKEEGCQAPDGIILVEELAIKQYEEEEMETSSCEHSCRTWGLVIQWKEMDYVTCYILRTTRVQSMIGNCTHYCLFRAKCFSDSAEIQLRNCWLQGI